LCDEATSALDPQTTKSILQLLKDINRRLQLTIVLITHQMEVVKEVCDRVAVIENGVIIEQETMFNLFTAPASATAKKFVQSVNSAELPEFLQQKPLLGAYAPGSKLLVRLTFIGATAGDPIVSGMVKRFAVDVNILFANIDYLKDAPYGTLVMEIDGDQKGIESAAAYLLAQNLKLEVLGYVPSNV
jgi:D-methionine transport system ATP-binding protein